MPWSRSQNVVSTLGMRKLALLAVPLLAACTTASEAPRKTYPENQEASAHLAKGLALFASAETAAVPSEALAGALPELEAAARLVPSPGNRFAHARTALVLDPADAAARAELASCLEEVPDDPRFLALTARTEAQDAFEAGKPADLDAPAALAEKALSIAALSSGREMRCFVGDHAFFTAAFVQRRNMDRAAKIVLAAAELGSPWALIDAGRLHWVGRGPQDQKNALECVKKAAETTFTPEEIGRGLLLWIGKSSRRAARQLGHMLVEDGDFQGAHPWLERGLAVKEDLVDDLGKPDPQAVVAFAERAAIEAMALDGDETFEARGRAWLKLAAELGFTPALVLRANLVKGEREALLALARERGAPGGYAGAGDFAGLTALAEKFLTDARNDREKLSAQRLLFFARAMDKGGSVRLQTEKEASEAVVEAPDNTTVTVAREFRHISGDLPADELQKTMPRSAHSPRWRAETELALATRCLLLADKAGAIAHLEELLKAAAIFTTEDEVAWGALEALKK